MAEENEFRNVLELLDPDSKKTSVLLHIMANGKNPVRNNTRQVKVFTFVIIYSLLFILER